MLPFSMVKGQDSPFYLSASGMAQLSRSIGNGAKTYSAGLSAGYFISPSFTFEVGVSAAHESQEANSKDISSESNTFGIAFTYRRHFVNNLTYMPQLSIQFQHLSVYDNSFDILIPTIIPIAFEYRDDDSKWGFQVGIGHIGWGIPLSKNFTDSEPAFIYSLNRIQVGVVKYF